jgi:signal transduction histidine kinase
MISNAIKFTPVGGEICIESRKVGTAYLITVSDSGAGIEMDLINQLLSPNYAFNHNSRSGHGHGIGLNLSHQLVKKINGKISIESQVGKGTRVTIHIPVTTS